MRLTTFELDTATWKHYPYINVRYDIYCPVYDIMLLTYTLPVIFTYILYLWVDTNLSIYQNVQTLIIYMMVLYGIVCT